MPLIMVPSSSSFPGHFGASDRPRCKSCGGPGRIVRREPHPVFGLKFELQTFTCTRCRDVGARSVNEAGEVIDEQKGE